MNENASLNSRPFRIGDWLVVPEINRIIHPNGKHNIGSRTMQVLVNLAENQGRVVTKETLMETVWQDVVVTEDSLMKSISVLRKIFEQSGVEKPKIDTIRSVGYVLLSPIEYEEPRSLIEKVSSRKSQVLVGSSILALILLALGYYGFRSGPKSEKEGVIAITNSRSNERVPRISPDGMKVMFAGGAGGNNNMDICIKNLKTDQLRHIENSDNIETDPIWSPDGSQIAFFRNDGKSIRIIIKNIDDDWEEEVIDVNSIVNLSAMIWSPDGKYIIYSDQPEGQRSFALHRVNLKNKQVEQLTEPHERIIGDCSPRISPDGKKMVFIRSFRHSNLYYHIIPGYGKMIIKDMKSGEETEVNEQAEEITGVSWIDNYQLAYSFVYKNYRFRIATIDLDSSKKTNIHETSYIIRNLDFHYESNQLVFEEWDETYNIWRFSDLPQKTNFSSRHIKSVHTSWNPAYHEKSNRLVFVSRQSGYAEVWVQDLNTETAVQMTTFNGPIVRYPQWSPDGRNIVFEVNEDRNDNIYILDMESGQSQRIIEDRAEEKFPVWSEDGKSIFYGSNYTERWQLRKWTLADSTDVQLTNQGGARAIPHKGTLYYCLPYSRGLWKLENGEEKMIIKDFIPNDMTNWTIVGEKIFYISRSRYAKPELYYLDLNDDSQHHYQSFYAQISYTFSGLTYDTENTSWLITLKDVVRSDIKMIVLDESKFSTDEATVAAGYAFSQ